ncbi:MAG: glycosyltransferase family 2 protein [Sphingobacteriales bacterium]|nr:MAG: glycosyltransferase family 2 protein [Sphingobacteriales bacterium]
MVSIIIPHFNRSVLLRETIQSVLNQTVDEWELIIVDDGSSQSELDKVKAFKTLDKRIRVFERQLKHKGPSACRNEGAQRANFPYLIFLDSDDLLKPFCVQQRLLFMQVRPDTDMAVFLEENFSQVPGDLGTFFNLKLPPEKLIGSFLQNKNPWQTMAAIWRKSCFIRIGGFNLELFYMEDPELHVRALLDAETKIEICYHLPADCYYRANYNDDTKKLFYYNSIYHRILFYDIIATELASRNFLLKYQQDYKKGIYRFIRQFVYARIIDYPELFKRFLNMLSSHSIFNPFEVRKIKWLIEIGTSQSHVARILRLKGLCYHLFPAV